MEVGDRGCGVGEGVDGEILAVLLIIAQHLIDVFSAAEENGRSLVNLLWLDVENRYLAVGGLSTGLFHQEGHRYAFVE